MTARRSPAGRLVVAGCLLGALAGCGGGSGSDLSPAGVGRTAAGDPASVTAAGPPDAQTVTVEARSDPNRFVPVTVDVAVGTVTLTEDNTGGVPHNFQASELGASIPIVNGGESQSVTFTVTTPGTYRFVCTFHAGMAGVLRVS